MTTGNPEKPTKQIKYAHLRTKYPVILHKWHHNKVASEIQDTYEIFPPENRFQNKSPYIALAHALYVIIDQ